jgi:hypothetical protein
MELVATRAPPTMPLTDLYFVEWSSPVRAMNRQPAFGQLRIVTDHGRVVFAISFHARTFKHFLQTFMQLNRSLAVRHE